MNIFCDFDGTISRMDVVNFILSRLADPSWNEIEAEWVSGKIGSRECLRRQIPLIRGGWEAIEPLLSEVTLEPTFSDFASWCAARNYPLVVVSDGLEEVIGALLKREKIKVAGIWANRLIETDAGELSLCVPYSSESFDCLAGVCKCQFLPQAEVLNVVIGDGRSDFCWAKKADFVFAKSDLLAHCREFQIPHESFNDFNEVRSSFERILKRRKRTLQPQKV